MKIIHKKIKEQYLDDIVNGDKTFEIRKDEDDIEVGDIIHFLVIPERLCNEVYCQVKYKLKNVPGLKAGYALYSIEVIDVDSKGAFRKSMYLEKVVRNYMSMRDLDNDKS